MNIISDNTALLNKKKHNWVIHLPYEDSILTRHCYKNAIYYEVSNSLYPGKLFYVIPMADDDALVLKIIYPDLKKIKW